MERGYPLRIAGSPVKVLGLYTMLRLLDSRSYAFMKQPVHSFETWCQEP